MSPFYSRQDFDCASRIDWAGGKPPGLLDAWNARQLVQLLLIAVVAVGCEPTAISVAEKIELQKADCEELYNEYHFPIEMARNAKGAPKEYYFVRPADPHTVTLFPIREYREADGVIVLDRWGRPLTLQLAMDLFDSRKAYVYSFGPDGKEFNNDDIVFPDK